MSEKKVRIAVIGAGAMGQNHIRFVKEEEATTLVAIVDAFEGARKIADEQGVPFYHDAEEMILKEKPDGVIIVTPNHLHLPVARVALKYGVPMLVEKPISDDLEDAKRFAEEAKQANVPVLVGQHRRYNPFVNKAKEIITSGQLGTLTVSSFHYMIYKNDSYFDVEWRRKKGAGPILVNLVHDVDLLRYLIGEIDSVQGLASSNARGFETEDSAVVNVRFRSGALASLTISDATVSPWNWEATSREDPQYRPFDADAYFIGGTKGSLSLPRLHQFSYDGDASWHKPLAMDIQPVDPQLPHKMQLKHFVQVIEGNERPIVTPADNVKTLETIMAIKTATETNGLVKLS
ncbi:Gfo/Idh/MocA family protein [Enterococcus camelliae]|uniref:Gfo/Idh/MocA family protein n=1 Tax=Enterococcus camelliae TaxID=453959 RepID=A0ABW5TMT2_9ENTE